MAGAKRPAKCPRCGGIDVRSVSPTWLMGASFRYCLDCQRRQATELFGDSSLVDQALTAVKSGLSKFRKGKP